MRKWSDILAERARPDDRDLTSRSDLRHRQKEEEERLAVLARRLAGLSRKRLASLTLPEELLDAVMDAQRIDSASARNRQLRVVRRVLRSACADVAAIERQLLDGPHAGPSTGAVSYWAKRLVAEGDAALGELVVAYPNIDTQRLRRLIRNACRAMPGADPAYPPLTALLREIVAQRGE